MHLAYFHPLRGHPGVENTLEKNHDHFHWLGMGAEVRNFVQRCKQCQQTSVRKPAPAPFFPLPIINVPFEQVEMDLIGPLPKSDWGL